MRGGRRSGLRMPLPPIPFYHGFHKVKQTSGFISKTRERMATSGHGPDLPLAKRFRPRDPSRTAGSRHPPPPGGDIGKCHVLSWSAAPPVPSPPVRIPHAVPPSRFVPLRSGPAAAGPAAAGPCFARIARARPRPSAPARFARLIAPARARAQAQGAPLLSVPLGVFFAPLQGKRRSGPRTPLPPDLSYHDFTGVKSLLRLFSHFMNKPLSPAGETGTRTGGC